MYTSWNPPETAFRKAFSKAFRKATLAQLSESPTAEHHRSGDVVISFAEAFTEGFAESFAEGFVEGFAKDQVSPPQIC